MGNTLLMMFARRGREGEGQSERSERIITTECCDRSSREPLSLNDVLCHFLVAHGRGQGRERGEGRGGGEGDGWEFALNCNTGQQAHMIRLNLSMFLVRWTQTNSLNGNQNAS